MSGELTQPKVDQYIHWLSRDDHFGMHGCVYDDKSDKLLDEFFELIEQIAPVSKNGVRALWLRAERGPIEDYGNAEEEVACGDFDSVEEFIEEWKAWFPDEIKWYQLQAVQLKDEGYRAVMLGHKYVSVTTTDGREKPFEMKMQFHKAVVKVLVIVATDRTKTPVSLTFEDGKEYSIDRVCSRQRAAATNAVPTQRHRIMRLHFSKGGKRSRKLKRGIAPMLSKEGFCKALQMIKEQEAIDEQFSKALNLVGNGHFVFGAENKYLLALRDILKEAVNDQYDYIDWWLYEATNDYTVWEADCTMKYCLKEPEALYDYITGTLKPVPVSPEGNSSPRNEVDIEMKHKLPPLSEMERIEQSLLSEKLDEILDRIDNEDIGFVITENGLPKVVIVPFRWFSENFPDEVPDGL